MAVNFSCQLTIAGKNLSATFIPQFRKDGMHWEVNVKNYPRFFMKWSPLDRYEAVGEDADALPYELVLAASDAIEKLAT